MSLAHVMDRLSGSMERGQALRSAIREWMAELVEALGEDAELAQYVWGCEARGNFFDESSRERTGANILHLPRTLADSARQHSLTEDQLRAKVDAWREKLLALRGKRVRPLLDDKVVTDWNGLMIGALARASVQLGATSYLAAAQEAASFVLDKLVDNGRLLHRYRKGTAGIKGFAEDYAFFINGLIALYQATFNARWLAEADRLAGEMLRLFQHENGLLYTQGSDEDDRMIAANVSVYDGAIPSANSAGALALLRLGHLLQRDEYLKAGAGILEAMSSRLVSMPTAHAYGLMALEWLILPVREVVFSGPEDHLLVREVREHFHPRTVVLMNNEGTRALVPFIASQGPVEGKPAAYVCENYTCKAPVTTPEALAAALSQ